MKFKFSLKEIYVALVLIGSCLVWDYNHIGDWIRTGKMKWLFLAAAIYGGGKVADIWHKSVGLLFVACMASFLWLSLPIYATLDIVNIVTFVFLVPLLFQVKTELLIDFIVTACVANSVVALMQLAGLQPFWPLGGQWVINPQMGFLGHPTMFGPLMVVGFSCVLFKGLVGNKKWLLLAFLFAAQICLTASVMSVVSLVAVIIAYVFFMWSKKISAILLALSILTRS